MNMNTVRALGLPGIAVAGVVLLAACGGGGNSGAGTGGEATAGHVKQATAVPLPPTATPGAGKIDFLASAFPKPPGGIHENPVLVATAAAAEGTIIGNPETGEELFASLGCSSCHSTGSDVVTGPGLGGMKDRRAQRVKEIPLIPRGGVGAVGDQATGGMVAIEKYVEDSIVNPGRYVIPGFENLMLKKYKTLPAQDIADLVAYVESLP